MDNEFCKVVGTLILLQPANEDDYLIIVKLGHELSCYAFNDSSHLHHDIVVPNKHHTDSANTV